MSEEISLPATKSDQVIEVLFDEMPDVTLHTVKRTDRAKRFAPSKVCSSIQLMVRILTC